MCVMGMISSSSPSSSYNPYMAYMRDEEYTCDEDYMKMKMSMRMSFSSHILSITHIIPYMHYMKMKMSMRMSFSSHIQSVYGLHEDEVIIPITHISWGGYPQDIMRRISSFSSAYNRHMDYIGDEDDLLILILVFITHIMHVCAWWFIIHMCNTYNPYTWMMICHSYM